MMTSQRSYSQAIYGMVSKLGSLAANTIFQVSLGYVQNLLGIPPVHLEMQLAALYLIRLQLISGRRILHDATIEIKSSQLVVQ